VGPQLDRIEAGPAEGDTLLFIHYFGLRNREALQRIGTWRDEGVQVIEDCVQAALTTSIGVHGDYAITSLRKLLPVPDGALLASRKPVAFTAEPSSEEFVVAKLAGKLLRGASVDDALYLRLFEHAEALLDDARPRHMSWLSDRLLRAADLESAAVRRRTNWTHLTEALRQSPRLRGLVPLFDTLGDGEAPLGLPVCVPRNQRDVLRRHLAQQRIFCAVHWPLDHLPTGTFAAERALAAELLTLPIDQRYASPDMARVVEALEAFPGDLA
jgi:dTDP-4-amino-4,6-dideoxygalactose transaminase